MATNYKTEAVKELAAQIKQAGFRVFIAASGTYGFFTDAEGTRVVSFQYDLGGFKFSGNYEPVNLREHGPDVGKGWVMGDAYQVTPEGLRNMFNSTAPRWATGGRPVTLTTLAQHLANYQKSSKYVEFQPHKFQLNDRVTVKHGAGVIVGWEAFDSKGMTTENSLVSNGNRAAIRLDAGHSWPCDSLYYERESDIEKEGN